MRPVGHAVLLPVYTCGGNLAELQEPLQPSIGGYFCPLLYSRNLPGSQKLGA